MQAERTQTPNQGLSEVIVSFVLVPSVSILPLRWESNEALADGTLSSTPNHPLRGSQEIWKEEKLMERNEWRPEPSFNYDRDLKVQVKVGIKIAPPDGSIREEQSLGQYIVLEAIKLCCQENRNSVILPISP